MDQAIKLPVQWCLLYIDWEPICMPRSEWSGWAQAIGAVVLLLVSIGVPYIQSRGRRKETEEAAKSLVNNVCRSITLFNGWQEQNVGNLALTAKNNLLVDLEQAKSIPLHLLDVTQAQGVRQMMSLATMFLQNTEHFIASKGEHVGPYTESIEQLRQAANDFNSWFSIREGSVVNNERILRRRVSSGLPRAAAVCVD